MFKPKIENKSGLGWEKIFEAPNKGKDTTGDDLRLTRDIKMYFDDICKAIEEVSDAISGSSIPLSSSTRNFN